MNLDLGCDKRSLASLPNVGKNGFTNFEYISGAKIIVHMKPYVFSFLSDVSDL